MLKSYSNFSFFLIVFFLMPSCSKNQKSQRQDLDNKNHSSFDIENKDVLHEDYNGYIEFDRFKVKRNPLCKYTNNLQNETKAITIGEVTIKFNFSTYQDFLEFNIENGIDLIETFDNKTISIYNSDGLIYQEKFEYGPDYRFFMWVLNLPYFDFGWMDGIPYLKRTNSERNLNNEEITFYKRHLFTELDVLNRCFMPSKSDIGLISYFDNTNSTLAIFIRHYKSLLLIDTKSNKYEHVDFFEVKEVLKDKNTNIESSK